MNDVERYAAKEIELMGRRLQAVEAITAAEQAAGTALLDGDGEATSAPVEAVIRASAQVSAIDSAVRTCRERRLEAIRAKRRGDAAELRKQILELREQLEKLEAKIAKHVAAISELQGVPFVALSASAWNKASCSQELQSQSTSFEIRAAALEADQLPQAGSVDVENVTTVDELVLAVLRHESDGPSAESISAWALGCEKHGRLSRMGRGMDQRDFGDSLRNYHLVWRNGVIVYDESRTQVPEIIRTEPGKYSGRPIADPGSDIFRCPAPASVQVHAT
jgi:hypothetical protein